MEINQIKPNEKLHLLNYIVMTMCAYVFDGQDVVVCPPKLFMHKFTIH